VERFFAGAFHGRAHFLAKGNTMRLLLVRLVRDDHGQDLIEYAFLAIFVALAVTVGLQAITEGMNVGFSNIGTQVGGS
jgi:Flp pilus assembly pilin Flp